MKDKINNSKSSAKQAGADVRLALKNGNQLLEAVSLLIVGGYAVYKNLPHDNPSFVSVVVLTAGILIGLRGSIEFFKHLTNK